jgi:hypothetical protein
MKRIMIIAGLCGVLVSGANAWLDCEYEGYTSLDLALRAAVRANDVEQARQLIAQGARAQQHWGVDQPHVGDSLLSEAVGYAGSEMVLLLVNAGADVNDLVTVSLLFSEEDGLRNVRGHRVLVLAILLNKPEIVRLLIDGGADVSRTDLFGLWTPLAVARTLGNREEIVRILRDAAAAEPSRVVAPCGDVYFLHPKRGLIKA